MIEDWTTSEAQQYVAPLHVHYGDDEAWHVISGALRFRFGSEEITAAAGSTVLVPAGTPHTFGNAGPGPSRYIIILPDPDRLQRLISRLHASERSEHPDIFRAHQSALLE
ncbi:MAG: cupin domain-containing protein [Solirubrobacteraceae bacterium]